MDHSYLFKLLNIPDDGSIIINDVEIIADTKYVYISRPSIPSYCPNCSCRMHSKGIYKRKIKHPVLQDGTCIIFIVSQRKWKCTNCSTYVNEDFPFFQRYKQSSDITPLLVLEAMKDLDRSTASIARQFNLSDTQVHDLFTAYVDLPRLTLPEFLSVDEVTDGIIPLKTTSSPFHTKKENIFVILFLMHISLILNYPSISFQMLCRF